MKTPPHVVCENGRLQAQEVLDRYVALSTCVGWAVVTAEDGLPRHWSGDIPDHACPEHLAVLAASLRCLAQHAADELAPGAGFRQVVVEMPALDEAEGPSRLVIAPCAGGCVAAGGVPGADASLLGSQFLALVERLNAGRDPDAGHGGGLR